MNKYLCIHGHFYQPPRENPWLEEIEIQESAIPYKNWNERITAECYYPNANAHILNQARRIKQILNNYNRISFNFGPTLLSWLEEYDNKTYQAILDADKESIALNGGHGNAIAQVYNHMIMPLANQHDKETQIIWGIKDFEHRFKRAPEGMWLAETACDTQTLMMLAANGIKYTILAPNQCKKTRKIGDGIWREESGAQVDTKRPYLCKLPNGKTINLFFYDGPISQGIAFGGTLNNGENFAKYLIEAFDNRSEPQLVHIATDGETYGHHHRFAEMALAYCINYIESNKLAELVNYGLFLEKFPPSYEAVINENTSWSCAHGVERWRADCGCNSAGKPGWNQKWRGPLRDALDFAREKMLETFENRGKEYFHDIWAARNAYIEVILDRSKTAKFLEEHGTDVARNDAPTALKLMQMQLNAMLMYTSCGWFFDEISGIETTQIMAYAKRALGYNKAITSNDIEPQFQSMLEAAPSNVRDYKNGAVIYEKFVKPVSIGLRKVAINYAVSYLLDQILFEDNIYGYEISDQKVDVMTKNDSKLVSGFASFTSYITTELRNVSFVVLHTGGTDMLAGAMYGYASTETKQIKQAFNEGKMDLAKGIITDSFSEILVMRQLLREKQRQMLSHAIEETQERVQNSFINIFNQERYFLNYFKEVNFPMPPLILNVAEFVLNSELKKEVLKDTLDEERISATLENIKLLGAKVYESFISHILTKRLDSLVTDYISSQENIEKAQKLTRFLASAQKLSLPVDKYKASNTIFRKVEAMPKDLAGEDAVKSLCEKLNIER